MQRWCMTAPDDKAMPSCRRLTAEESKFRALLAHRADADKKLRVIPFYMQFEI
jgi:hypothetical protein